jgi:hypothetical protein
MGPEENPRRFTSQWAIPRVEPQDQLKPRKKKRQMNNLAILFVIYVFKRIKKLVSPESKPVRNR